MFRRRFSDLLTESAFLEVQLIVLRESGPAHLTRQRGVRLARVHRRLYAMERRLRLMAMGLADDQKVSISALRGRLSHHTDRRRTRDSAYSGPERRRVPRREADRRAGGALQPH